MRFRISQVRKGEACYNKKCFRISEKELQKRLADVNGGLRRLEAGYGRQLAEPSDGDCAVFLDPPYAPETGRSFNVYLSDDLDGC